MTSEAFDANLGGLNGADGKCAAAATAGGLTGVFKAWLSDGTTDAASRLAHSSDPYQLPTGTLVAANWAALTSGTLAHAIDETEFGAATPPVTGTVNSLCGGVTNQGVWTFTQTDGSRQSGSPCGDWTDNAAASSPGSLTGGIYSATNPQWTDTCSTSAVGACADKAQLYCLEQ